MFLPKDHADDSLFGLCTPPRGAVHELKKLLRTDRLELESQHAVSTEELMRIESILASLRDRPRLGIRCVSPHKTSTPTSIHFDTDDWKLRRDGAASLRVRLGGSGHNAIRGAKFNIERMEIDSISALFRRMGAKYCSRFLPRIEIEEDIDLEDMQASLDFLFPRTANKGEAFLHDRMRAYLGDDVLKPRFITMGERRRYLLEVPFKAHKVFLEAVGETCNVWAVDPNATLWANARSTDEERRRSLFLDQSVPTEHIQVRGQLVASIPQVEFELKAPQGQPVPPMKLVYQAEALIESLLMLGNRTPLHPKPCKADDAYRCLKQAGLA